MSEQIEFVPRKLYSSGGIWPGQWVSVDGTYSISEYDYDGDGYNYKKKHHFHAYRHDMNVNRNPKEQSYPTFEAARLVCEEDLRERNDSTL